LALVARRFRNSQGTQGGWNYTYAKGTGGGEYNTMTAAGLMGLGVGHGLDVDLGDRGRKKVDDPALNKAMARLGTYIGGIPEPPKGGKGVYADIYFLWSVERVAMLCGVAKVGDKDWYAWAVAHLLAAQQADGSWPASGVGPQCLSTAFGLLILKRTNLVKDLSKKVEFVIDSSKK
jgi:hypothetical protein